MILEAFSEKDGLLWVKVPIVFTKTPIVFMKVPTICNENNRSFHWNSRDFLQKCKGESPNLLGDDDSRRRWSHPRWVHTRTYEGSPPSTTSGNVVPQQVGMTILFRKSLWRARKAYLHKAIFHLGFSKKCTTSTLYLHFASRHRNFA